MSDRYENMKRKKIEFKIIKEESADLRKFNYTKLVLVAHHRQIELSKSKIEDNALCLSVLAEQNDLRLCFYRSIVNSKMQIQIQFDIADMVDAIDLLEKSVMCN